MNSLPNKKTSGFYYHDNTVPKKILVLHGFLIMFTLITMKPSKSRKNQSKKSIFPSFTIQKAHPIRPVSPFHHLPSKVDLLHLSPLKAFGAPPVQQRHAASAVPQHVAADDDHSKGQSRRSTQPW